MESYQENDKIVQLTCNHIFHKECIREWLQNITKADYELIRAKIEELSESGLETKFNASCQDCGHKWKTGVDLDIANFFGG